MGELPKCCICKQDVYPVKQKLEKLDKKGCVAKKQRERINNANKK